MGSSHPARDSLWNVIGLLLVLIGCFAGAWLWFDHHRRIVLRSHQAMRREIQDHRDDTREWQREVRVWMTEYEARKREDDGE